MSFATVLSLPPPVAEIGGVPAHDADLHCGRWSMRRNGRPSIGCLPRRTSRWANQLMAAFRGGHSATVPILRSDNKRQRATRFYTAWPSRLFP